MSSKKAHNHAPQITGDSLNRAFTIGIAINLIFVVVEFVAGIILDSVSLMSDAGHNLSDVVGLGLAMMAFRLAKVKPSEKYTYGLKKSTVIVSLANACILLVAIGFILFESVRKLTNPEPIQGLMIAWIAGVGVVVNGFTAFMLMRHKANDLNVKGAYLHMVADMLVSVGVVVSGVVIYYTGWYVIDPIIGIAIAVIIFISTWGLLRDSVRLSVDGVPSGLNVAEIINGAIELDSRIVSIHHPHMWALSTTENALTAHVVVESMDDAQELKQIIKMYLKEHDIEHATLEFELPNTCNGQC